MNRCVSLQSLLNEYFPGIALFWSEALFGQTSIGIRFELGGQLEICGRRMAQVFHRANTIFNSLYTPQDEMFLVVTSWSWSNGTSYISPKINVFRRCVKDKKLLRRLYCQEIPIDNEHDTDNEGIRKYRYVLPCTVKDVKTEHLFQAIGNHNMGLRPSINLDCYLVNVSKRLILHMYDDRGLDVIASSKDSLQGIYIEYNDWILEYDRDRIDAVFK